MKPRALFLASLASLAACTTNADGTFGGTNVVVRADQRPVAQRAEPPEPEPASEPASPPVAALPPFTGELADDRLPPPPQAMEHVPAPWPFDVQNYELMITVEPETHSIEGTVVIDVDDSADGLSELALDAVDLEIREVLEIDPASSRWHPDVVSELKFAYDRRTLRIPLKEPRRLGTRRRFAIRYSGRPQRGIFFNDGDPPQVYTQGEMEDSRYWFPCHDAPDDRATHSLQVWPSSGWNAIAAGSDHSMDIVAGNPPCFRFETLIPHVSYLTTLVAGDYELIRAKGIVPLKYLVEKRDAPYAAFDFRKTNDILKFFGDYTGLPYPYPKYSQTCVRNFMWGGMENISATTLTDHTIHPPDWEPARSSTSLVAHEAAHQWFGDWITSSHWSHCWLNEGFATYFDALFLEHDEGRDAFLWEMRGNRHGALGAMDGERRAVVSSKWVTPDEMFDGHAYPGGAMRIHMLRHLLGDKEFQQAIRHYVKKCGLTCVTTDDFQHAVEESTGRDLGWFFDQWLRKPGYPVLKIRWKWDAEKKAEIVTVEQTHKAEGGAPEAYRLPLDIAFGFSAGQRLWVSRRIEVTKRSETFEIPTGSQPECIVPDPESALLARFDLERSVDDFKWVASTSTNPSVQFEAAEALGAIVRDEKRPVADRDSAHVDLLRAFARAKYELPSMRAALAGLVASRKDDVSAQVLIDAMGSDIDLRVRLAASAALDEFKGNEKARDAIAAHLDDPNDLVRAASVAGIAKLKAPGAYERLLAEVERPGWQSVVRNAALRGFAELGDERAFPVLVRFAAPGDNWSRGAAIEVLGRMGRAKTEFRDAVLPYLDDPERHVRQAAADALAKIADPDTMGTLVAHFATENWPSCKEALRNAVRAVRAGAVESGRLVSVEAVRAAPIRERHAVLRDEADSLEESIKKLEGDAKTDAQARLKALHDEMAPLKRDLDALGVPVKPKPKAATNAPGTSR